MKENITEKIIINKYLEFFKSKGHKVISSASLIPTNDPTVLFTTAGMHPLVPYLMGETHPEGKRLVSVQKCIRTSDIDNVGDTTHCTFFEMLGNWSLGDYFKEDSIKWSYEFLTSSKYLNIDPSRLFFTVFEGDNQIPKDIDTYNIWKSHGIKDSHLFFMGKDDNFWGPVGSAGPCGPDTEIFYDTLKEKCSNKCTPSCSCGKYIEIWNNVFMEYNKLPDGSYKEFKQKNVDTGMGLERVYATLIGAESIYSTSLFTNIIKKTEELSNKKYDSEYRKSFRIIADHIRTAVFLLGDKTATTPSNTDQGYVLRRIIRRMIRHLKIIDIDQGSLSSLAKEVINIYSNRYENLKDKEEFIYAQLDKEEALFNKTINQGIREFNKIINKNTSNTLTGEEVFKLYDTYGFPLEFTKELADEKDISIDETGYNECYKKHQEKSRKGSVNKFKGGLTDDSSETIKLHTVTHVLHSVLRSMFGSTVKQKGCNITSERVRFDFSFDRKVTKEEIDIINRKVNEIINKNIDVEVKEMELEKALEEKAIGIFTDKYDEKVKVYTIDKYSKEICGGPHVKNTGEIGEFKIYKEESSSAGVRRIKAKIIKKTV